MTFADQFVATSYSDAEIIMGVTAPPFMKEPAIVTTLFLNGKEQRAKAGFKGLLHLEPLKDTTKERTYRKMNGMMNHLVPYGGRKLSLFCTTSFA